MRALLALIVVPLLLVAGCGRGATPSVGTGGPTAHASALPENAAASPCSPSTQPPVPTRLTGHSEKVGDGILDPVDPGVQPATSGAAAWHAAQFKPTASGCDVAEILGYYSATSPGTIAAQCGQTPLGLNEPACQQGTPNYQHRLVWMISWSGSDNCFPRSQPAPAPGQSPASPATPQSRFCHWFEPIDATTGKYDFAGSSG
jgi:hypothetical protein